MNKNHSYANQESAADFGAYSKSKDAKIEQELLYEAISKFLQKKEDRKVLDAACGTGWLAERLFCDGYEVTACDISPDLLKNISDKKIQIKTDICDLNVGTPYEKESFNSVIINMSCHDFRDLKKALKYLAGVLSKDGKMIITITNPYYSHPVGRWKRGLWRFIIGKKPLLKLFPYNFFRRCDRKHVWKGSIPSYFYSLPEYFEAAFEAGLNLEHFGEISSEKDSRVFDRKYQLFRFPMILIMVFGK